MLNQQLAEELNKPIIKNIEKREVQPSFKTIFGEFILPICK